MLNRFDNYNVGYDWRYRIPQLAEPQLNVGMLEQLMAQQQQQADQARLISEKNPSVLNTEYDQALYKNYRSTVQDGLSAVAQAYQKNITEGNRAYKNYLNQVRDAWQPGGTADVLNRRYQGYQEALTKINDFYKDDPNPVNKTLAKYNLQQQLNRDIDYNPTTRTFNSISTPELYKTPDVRKAVDELLKGVESNDKTVFQGNLNSDWWIKKIQTESRPEEKIRLAYQALAEMPEFASQIQRDAQYAKLNTDPVKYQENYNQRIDRRVSALETLISSAEKDPKSAIQLQQVLASNGYNVSVDGQFGPLTKTAATELLKSQKEQAQQLKSNFNLDASLRKDAYDAYGDYAARGAFTKTKEDLIFNKAKQTMFNAAKAKERNDALIRAVDNLAPQKTSDITVTSGIAQQLPKLDKYYQESKELTAKSKADLDKALSNSNGVFNGWKSENVAEAYRLWDNTVRKLPPGSSDQEKMNAYAAALRANSSYQFSDNDVRRLYQEMNDPASTTKTVLNAYNSSQSEVDRLESIQVDLASQYLNTQEGKQAINGLRNSAPPALKGLSDEQLIREAVANPQLFEKAGDYRRELGPEFNIRSPRTNGAETFMNTMRRDIDRQSKAGTFKYDWGSMGTYEVIAGKSDDYVRPLMDNLSSNIENGVVNQFVSEGKAGLVLRNPVTGDEIANVDTKKVTGLKFGKNIEGKPVMKVSMSVTSGGAKPSTQDAVAEIELVPGSPEAIQAETSLRRAYVAKMSSGEPQVAQGILDVVDALNGKDGVQNASIDLQLKTLNTKNTTNANTYYMDESRSLVPISNNSWRVKDLQNDITIVDPQTNQPIVYKTVGVNTPTGNKVTAAIETQNGELVLLPDAGFHNSSAGVQKYLLSKEIISTTPVERDYTKVPKGTIQLITNQNE